MSKRDGNWPIPTLASKSRPQLPVQGTILNRLGNVVARNGFRARQILSLICERNPPESEPPYFGLGGDMADSAVTISNRSANRSWGVRCVVEPWGRHSNRGTTATSIS
jgi:hypothetical protein